MPSPFDLRVQAAHRSAAGPRPRANDEDRAAARVLFERDFGRARIVAFGQVMDIDQMPSLVAQMHLDISGALAYRQRGDALHLEKAL
jgi:hypothetical protein